MEILQGNADMLHNQNRKCKEENSISRENLNQCKEGSIEPSLPQDSLRVFASQLSYG
jgi:hypothetical protein